MPGPVYYELLTVYYLEGAVACLDLSIITRILVSGLWDGPGMPGPVYYNPNPCVWVLGWAWHAWACLL